MSRWSLFVLVLSLGAGTLVGQKDGEWAKGVKYHTKWKDAIKEVQKTGKLLFVYNGWQSRNV